MVSVLSLFFFLIVVVVPFCDWHTDNLNGSLSFSTLGHFLFIDPNWPQFFCSAHYVCVFVCVCVVVVCVIIEFDNCAKNFSNQNKTPNCEKNSNRNKWLSDLSIFARECFFKCVCGFCAHCAQREMTHLMGPTECASAMVACTMPFLDNGLGANLAADYGCYSNEYWTSPYTAGGLSPMKQIEGE